MPSFSASLPFCLLFQSFQGRGYSITPDLWNTTDLWNTVLNYVYTPYLPCFDSAGLLINAIAFMQRHGLFMT